MSTPQKSTRSPKATGNEQQTHRVPSKFAEAASGPTPTRRSGFSPRQKAMARRTVAAAQKGPRLLFPQWLRTVLVVLLWLGAVPLYLQLVSPYVTYSSARTMAVGLAIFAGLAPHVWPSRTSPWRTAVWSATVTTFLGMGLLVLGSGRLGLAITTVVGFGIVVLRANENGRKLVRLIRTWRTIR